MGVSQVWPKVYATTTKGVCYFGQWWQGLGTVLLLSHGQVK